MLRQRLYVTAAQLVEPYFCASKWKISADGNGVFVVCNSKFHARSARPARLPRRVMVVLSSKLHLISEICNFISHITSACTAALDVLHFHKYILNVGTRRKRNHPLRANGCERIRYYDLAQDAQ